MNCKKVSNLISAYLDREVSEDEERKIRHHLAYCSDCYSEYSKLKSVKEILESLEEEELPQGFWESTRTKLKYENSPSRTRTWSNIFSPLAAAACLLLALAIFSPRAGHDRIDISGLTGSNRSLAPNSISGYGAITISSTPLRESDFSSNAETRSYDYSGSYSGSLVRYNNTVSSAETRDTSLKTSVFVDQNSSASEPAGMSLREYGSYSHGFTLVSNE